MKRKHLFIFVFMLIAFLPPVAIPGTFKVINTNDSGAGSLRQALLDANANSGADTVIFNIPTSDPNYDTVLGVWTIAPLSGLPAFSDDGTTIDGTTQSAFVGSDPNPNGPEIELDGTNAGDVDGLYILSTNNIIKGLVINRFKHFGIQITYNKAHHNVVSGCYVGIDVTGTTDLGNGFSGIIMYNGAKKNLIGGKTTADRNVVSGNDWSGIEIQSWNADSNLVIGNYIGTDATGSKDVGNSSYGIYIWSGAQGNIIGGNTPEERNIVSANHWDGVAIIGPNTNNNIIIGNYIGTNWSGTEPLPNGFNGIVIGSRNGHNLIGGRMAGQGNLVSCNENSGIGVFGSTDNMISGNIIGTDPTGVISLGNKNCGISLGGGSHHNIVGPKNVITNSGSEGIRVEHDTTLANTITQNSITNNYSLGIENIDGGNTELGPQIIIAVTRTSVSGTALPNSTVEIFSDGEDEGGVFEGEILSDTAGNFSWTGTPTGPHLTATVTDAAGNTSEFSPPYSTDIEDVKIISVPTKFALHQNYPNPFSANGTFGNPSTVISYQLPVSSQVELSIYNLLGQKIVTLVSEEQSAGIHKLNWDARGLASGVYLYRLEAGEFVQTRKLILLR